MPLFQPTNITPDLISGVQNGVVFVPPNNLDPDTTVPISWTVNGNVPMVAYQIDFYKNNAASTGPFSTGKITLDTPFSAIDANGNQTRFTCDVLWQKVYQATVLVPRHEGKFVITQWWGATDDQSVVQKSPSVYRVNQRATLAVSGPTGSGGIYTFTGTFTPPDYSLNGEVALEWTRWQLFEGNPLSIGTAALQDTGKIWGASAYTWTPDMIPPGLSYYVTFSGLTTNGELLTANTSTFSSMEDTVILEMVTAECDKQGNNVQVQIPYSASAIQGEAWWSQNGAQQEFPDYYNSSIGLSLDVKGLYAIWNNLPDTNTPWAFIWHGVLNSNYGTPFFELAQSNGTRVFFGYIDGTIQPGSMDADLLDCFAHLAYIDQNGQNYYDALEAALQNVGDSIVENPPAEDLAGMSIETGAEVWITFSMGKTALTKNTLYWKVTATKDGQTNSASGSVSGFTQGSVTSVKINAGTTTKSWTLQYGDIGLEPSDGDTPSQANAYIHYPGSVSPEDGYADFILFDSNGDGDGAIYRINGGSYYSGISQPITPFSLLDGQNGITVYDYATQNGSTYRYMALMPAGEGGVPVALISNTVAPCFWDWLLIEAEDEGETNFGQYYFVRAFAFACNVASGDNSNGNAPSVAPTFTPYPVVMRDTQNRHSGTLSALIGYVLDPGVYHDDNSLRDQIRALSTTQNTLFLRNRRGDFMKIAIAGEIVNTTSDNSVGQEQGVRIPWVEIGPVTKSVFSSSGG